MFKLWLKASTEKTQQKTVYAPGVSQTSHLIPTYLEEHIPWPYHQLKYYSNGNQHIECFASVHKKL